MWEVQGEARAEGLLPGREQNTAIIRQGSAGRKRLLTHRKLNSAGIGPSCEGQGSVLSAVEHSRWGSSQHSLPSHSCSSSPSLMALQHNPLGEGMLPCRAGMWGSFLGPRRTASPTGEGRYCPARQCEGRAKTLRGAEPRTGSFQFFWQCLPRSVSRGAGSMQALESSG